MDTQKLANWSEIVASVAVVITLVFLILEVRQNTDAVERQALLERQARLINPYLASPEFRSVYVKIKEKDGREDNVAAFIDYYDLAHGEAVLWVRHLDENWSGLEADFLKYGESDDMNALITGFLSFPDARLYWLTSASADRFNPEFRSHVESLRLQLPEHQQAMPE